MIKKSMLEYIKEHKDEWVSIRKNLHSNPESSMNEIDTTNKIKKILTKWGFQIIDLEKTGLIAVLKHGTSNKSVAIRTCIDAAKTFEESDLEYKSNNGYMHSSGNDGCMSMLLGACQYLSETRDFNGIFYAIFQPGGNTNKGFNHIMKAIDEKKIKIDSIFSIGIAPKIQTNVDNHGDFCFYMEQGPMLASNDIIGYKIIGKGSDSSSPQNSNDPIITASSIVFNLQTIISRNIPPSSRVSLSVSSFNSEGNGISIPNNVKIKINVKCFENSIKEYVLKKIDEIIESTCNSFDCKFEKSIIGVCPTLVNNYDLNLFANELAVDLFGEEKVHKLKGSLLISNDFSKMLEQFPGSFLLINNGNSADLYNNKFDFNDNVIPFGVCFYSSLVERKLDR